MICPSGQKSSPVVLVSLVPSLVPSLVVPSLVVPALVVPALVELSVAETPVLSVSLVVALSLALVVESVALPLVVAVDPVESVPPVVVVAVPPTLVPTLSPVVIDVELSSPLQPTNGKRSAREDEVVYIERRSVMPRRYHGAAASASLAEAAPGLGVSKDRYEAATDLGALGA